MIGSTHYPEALTYFLINSSMLGLAISIALYSFVIPKVNEIFSKQAEKLKKANERLRKLTDDFSKKVQGRKTVTSLLDELKEASLEVEKYKKVDFHYGVGFLLTGVLFSIATIISLFDIFMDDAVIATFSIFSPYFLMIGIILLVYIWFMIFLDIKELLKQDLSKHIEEADKELEEAEELRKQENVKPKRGFKLKKK